jgi:hypothetical protein
MVPTSSEKEFLVGQWSVPLEQDPLSFGFLSQPVLAATDPLAQLGAAAEPLNLPLAEVAASGIDWARIDAAVASLNGQHGSAVFKGSSDLDLADYSTLVDLDQLTGLTVVDEPHLLPSTLLEANPPPLLWDAFNSDQLLVHKGSGDIDLLAGLEALRLGDGDDAIVISNVGQLIRTPVSEIREIGRNTQGVRVINMDDGESVKAFAITREVDETQVEETPSGEKLN